MAERKTSFQASRDAEKAADRDRRHKQHKQAVAIDKAFTAVNEGRSPSLDGCVDFGIVTVVDPGEAEQVRAGKLINALPRPKLTALRDDPVGRMHRRKQLGEDDDADVRLQAARHLQALYEAAELGGAQAIDPSKPQIQTSGVPAHPDTDRRWAAMKRITKVERLLSKQEGENGAELVRLVLWHKRTFSEMAAANGEGRREIEYLGERFRKCLDLVAVQLGYRSKRQTHGSQRRARDELERLAISLDKYADNPGLYAAVHRAKRSA